QAQGIVASPPYWAFTPESLLRVRTAWRPCGDRVNSVGIPCVMWSDGVSSLNRDTRVVSSLIEPVGAGAAHRRRDLAHPRKSASAIIRVELPQVFDSISDEWPLNHDGISLRLAGVEHYPSTLCACSHAQGARAPCIRPVQPTDLAGVQCGAVRAC